MSGADLQGATVAVLLRLAGVMVGGVLGLGVLLVLLLAVAARAGEIRGGTADEVPAGWCRCP